MEALPRGARLGTRAPVGAVMVRTRTGSYRSWRDWRAAVTRPAPRRPFPCPTCWGQGAVWETGILGWMPVVCPECLGAR